MLVAIKTRVIATEESEHLVSLATLSPKKDPCQKQNQRQKIKVQLTILNALIMHARGNVSIPISLSDGDVLRDEEDNIKSFGDRSELNFPFIFDESRPLVSIINSLSVDDSVSKSSFVGDDEWLFFLSLFTWLFNSIS